MPLVWIFWYYCLARPCLNAVSGVLVSSRPDLLFVSFSIKKNIEPMKDVLLLCSWCDDAAGLGVLIRNIAEVGAQELSTS